MRMKLQREVNLAKLKREREEQAFIENRKQLRETRVSVKRCVKAYIDGKDKFYVRLSRKNLILFVRAVKYILPKNLHIQYDSTGDLKPFTSCTVHFT